MAYFVKSRKRKVTLKPQVLASAIAIKKRWIERLETHTGKLRKTHCSPKGRSRGGARGRPRPPASAASGAACRGARLPPRARSCRAAPASVLFSGPVAVARLCGPLYLHQCCKDCACDSTSARPQDLIPVGRDSGRRAGPRRRSAASSHAHRLVSGARRAAADAR